MKNRTIAKEMQAHFKAIRTAVEVMRAAVLKRISQAADLSARNYERYNQDFLRIRQAEMRQNAESEINAVKVTALEKVRSEYAQINTLLTDWVTMPLPDKCNTMLRIYTDFNIQPTKAELQLLAETAQGSYFACRVVDGMGRRLGYEVLDFKTIEVIRREVDTARRDTENAIKNFAGIPDENHKLAADLLGLELAENRNLVVYSADFLENDNTFSRLERELSDITETEFSLLPSKRREIDKLFADVADADRTGVAVRLIESDDSMGDLLSLYDKNLFLDALAKIAQEKQAIAETLKASRAEVDAAAQDAVLAATEATLANVRASHN